MKLSEAKKTHPGQFVWYKNAPKEPVQILDRGERFGTLCFDLILPDGDIKENVEYTGIEREDMSPSIRDMIEEYERQSKSYSIAVDQ